MKKVYLLFLLMVLVSVGELSAQKVDGRLTISGFPNGRTLKEATAVDLFKRFREGAYKIKFSYKAENAGKRGLLVFDMKTTVTHNGKRIAESTRSNWPWLPGDMFVPIESFDLIPALQKFTFDVPSANVREGGRNRASDGIDLPLPKGKYEVLLQMIILKPGEDLGTLAPARFSFEVK